MIQGTIEDIAFGGDGVLKSDGLVIFVPFAAKEDLVSIAILKQKKSHAFGKILEIKKKGPSRIDPICPVFGTCGGCQLQHINYEAQLKTKQQFVEDALKRIGKVSFQVPPVIPSSLQWNYRRHITLQMQPTEKGFNAGFIAEDNSTLLPIAHCPLFTSDPIIQKLQNYSCLLSSDGIKEASVRIFKQEDKYLFAFSFSPKIPNNFSEIVTLEGKNIANIFAKSPSENIALKDEEPSFFLQDLRIYYSPFGFLQNHAEQSEKLYEYVLSKISCHSKKVLDVYSGIGILSLLIAKKGMEVISVESHPDTVRIAKKNAECNNLAVDFQEGRAEEVLPSILKKFAPDCIVVNPPRTGLFPSVITSLLSSGAKEIIYISCMPATLARDVKLLSSLYRIEDIQPFDMFPQTTHVETCVKLTLI